MNTHSIEGLSLALNIGFFDCINKKESIKLIYKKLDLFQEERYKKKGHNRGGIVSGTYDVLHALLACIAPTMDDIRKKQPELFIESVQEGQIFAFVYRTTLSEKVNRGSKAGRPVKETIGNQLKRLIEAGVITEKRNYSTRKDKNGKQVNPMPSDLNAKGRGKIQLFFDPSLLVFTSKYEQLKTYLKNSFQLYRVNPLFINTSINKSKIDSAPTVDNNQKALATAKGELMNIKNKELGRRLTEKTKVPARQFDRKEDFNTFQLFELSRARLFAGRKFTEAIEKGAFRAINDRIEQAVDAVRAYKAEKVRTYTATAKYKKSKQQDWMLKRYKEKLPDTYRAAIEIVGFAIPKQERNAINNNYLHKIQRAGNDPIQLFSSSNFEHALNYSINDWRKINNNFFDRIDKSYASYCNIIGMVGKIYTHVLKCSQENLVHGYQESLKAYNRLTEQINKNTLLTTSNKKTIDTRFKTMFSPLFSSLTKKERHHLFLSINKAA